MDFGAQNTFKSYQEIPTGALRPRNDILGSAVRLNDKLKFDIWKEIGYNTIDLIWIIIDLWQVTDLWL